MRAADLGSCWDTLATSPDLQRVVPLERWNIDLAYEPNNATGHMSMYTRFGAFCSSIADFDAAAMRIPQAEAAVMDPQQRLLLQAAAEAMTDAEGCTGYPVGGSTGAAQNMTCNCSDPACVKSWSGGQMPRDSAHCQHLLVTISIQQALKLQD